MATTLQQIQDRAVSWSIANGAASLVEDTALIIHQIAVQERALFDRAASLNSYYYAVLTTAASTNAAANRTLDLTTVAPTTAPVRRLLLVKLPNGTELNQVDLRDKDAEFAPRFFLRGRSVVEVGSEWSAATEAVTLTLEYMKGPAPLSTTGALTQTISLEDDFADLLELRLAWFLAHSDVGRDTPELERLEEKLAERMIAYDTMLAAYSGETARRFNIPTKRTQA